MVSFELSEEIEKDVFCLVTSLGQRKKFWVPMRNWNWDLQIPYSNSSSVVEHQSTNQITIRYPWLYLSNQTLDFQIFCSDSGSVVEHHSAEYKGQRFNSSWELRIFSLSHTRNKTKKTSFFIIQLIIYKIALGFEFNSCFQISHTISHYTTYFLKIL